MGGIRDSIATAQEIIQRVARHKESGFLLKMDFEKAYDTVEWECVIEALRSWGYGDKWVSWINLWLRSAKVSILVNGV